MVLLAFIFSLYIIKNILLKLKILENGLISYFDYVLRKKETFNEIIKRVEDKKMLAYLSLLMIIFGGKETVIKFLLENNYYLFNILSDI